MSLSPPNEDETTQPIAPASYLPAVTITSDPVSTNNQPNTSIQTGTLPSMAFEVNKSQPVQKVALPIALPFASNEELVVDYHEPVISQTLDPIEEHQSEAAAQTEEPEFGKSNSLPNVAEAAITLTTTSNPENDTKMAIDSDEKTTHVEKIGQEQNGIETDEDNSLDEEVSIPIVVAEPVKLTHEELLNQSIEEAMVDRSELRLQKQREEAVASQNSRSSRKRRVSSSQGVHYDYCESGTLQHESDDEDDFFASANESNDNSTQSRKRKAPTYRSASQPTRSMQIPEEVESSSDEEPENKKSKHFEITSNDDKVHEIDDDHPIHDVDDDQEVVECDDPTSKPRPSLGGVGEPHQQKATVKNTSKTNKDSETQQSKPKKSASDSESKPTKKQEPEQKEKIVETSDENVPAAKNEDKQTPSKGRTQRKVSKAPKESSEDDELYEDDGEEENEEVPTKMAKSSTSTPRKAGPKSASSTPKTSKKGSATDDSKLTSPIKKLSKEKQKAQDDLNSARGAISAFLNESDDMAAYFTQVSMTSSQHSNWDPPANLFAGVSFIVTGMRHVANPVANPTFIKQQIKALGGKVVNFRVEPRRKAKGGRAKASSQAGNKNNGNAPLPLVVLISEKPQRTLKYISALAAGVPCVHYGWFFACLSKGKIHPLENFLLPAGYSETSSVILLPEWTVLEDQSHIPIHERSPFMVVEDGDTTGKTADPARIEVIGTPDFRHQWEQTLKMAGAKIVQRLSYLSEGRIDYILSDSEPTDLASRQAKAIGLPLCTIDWALQTIIQRKIQDPESQPAYTIDNLDD